MEIQGRLVHKLFSDEAGNSRKPQAGDFMITEDGGRLTFCLPCNCAQHKDFGGLLVGGIKLSGEGAWTWNGSRENPTTSPSILVMSDRDGICPGWHGYLTDGIFRSC